jgi:hypothetical protein
MTIDEQVEEPTPSLENPLKRRRILLQDNEQEAKDLRDHSRNPEPVFEEKDKSPVRNFPISGPSHNVFTRDRSPRGRLFQDRSFRDRSPPPKAQTYREPSNTKICK